MRLHVSTSAGNRMCTSRRVNARASRKAVVRPHCSAGPSFWKPFASDSRAAAATSTTSEKADTASKGTLVTARPDEDAGSPFKVKTMNIVFVTSEVTPWSKTGGLADVCGSLPPALAARGHRVMVVAPRYSDYKEPTYTGVTATINGQYMVGYHHYEDRGVDWVFVDHPCYPRPGGIYSDAHGVYGDNQFRFMLLCLAALEAPLHLPLGEDATMYGEDCVFLANDWHAALVPVYLAAKYRPHGVYRDARSVLAIHNLRHQGVFTPGSYAQLGLPSNWYGCLEYQYPPHQRQGSWSEEGRSVNHLKAGLCTADRLVTVSPGYSDEIKTALGGWGMDGILTSRAPILDGIVNGIDMDEWNPAVDKMIAQRYTVATMEKGKAANKAALQRELGLPEDPSVPLVAFIGRLDYQKGADLVLAATPWLMSMGAQLVCLGTGTKDLEDGLRWMESSYRTQARGWVGFNVAMSHKITAAADLLLMPSRFEPCGLNQLYAMRYGTVPVAHSTGGLRDTVLAFDPWNNTGTGWTFSNCDVGGLKHALGLALHTFHNHRGTFRDLQQRGMLRDSSWDGAAQRYEQLFAWSKLDNPYCR